MRMKEQGMAAQQAQQFGATVKFEIDRANALAQWKALSAKIQTLEVTILKLMRHPDATPEQLVRAHKAYSDLWIRATAVETKFLTKYKPTMRHFKSFTEGRP